MAHGTCKSSPESEFSYYIPLFFLTFMAHEGKLAKVGIEAFDIVEEYKGKMEKPLPQSKHFKFQRSAKPKPMGKEEVNTIDSNQAAKVYGGVLIVGYRRRPKPSS